ncbi:SDR family NAD(P)-dependent oxidoreductase [Comamonas piscis]|uniref:SDR family NAD(P)-dependent oxidoreductase n=1 Tax=Comamonas piscis TaxID=1562974 RepID=A0A7G5EHI6_9BURK|nr:SDR family NAD(P)-dependent oxidoreductase [Comamonas piscis]QMV73461.1 SDR family NAD(P)-dependent oxidoreductase [Comamonas piscis]WSO31876.1 SDR family NAD(P)-dependent oxidoreductase [Comamonas piscis]
MRQHSPTPPSAQPVALVSGAGRGLGLAIAQELLAHGWRVSIGTRQPVPQLADHGPAQLQRSRFDALDADSETGWIAEAAAHFGRIDAIVHNAGVLSTDSVLTASDAEFDRLMAINVKSPMRLTRQLWPYLQQSPNGKVVVMASLAGKRVRAPEGSLYAISKHAALALAHGIRHCGGADRIRCTAICPGFVDTDMADGVLPEMRAQISQPADIATLVRTVLELPASASVAEIPVSWQVESQY